MNSYYSYKPVSIGSNDSILLWLVRMSVYFDFEIQPSSHQQISSHEQTAWHNSFALLAVSSKTESIQPGGIVTAGVVNVFLDEGELIEDATMQRQCMASLIKWHPLLKVSSQCWPN